jgi:hypothetical protein
MAQYTPLQSSALLVLLGVPVVLSHDYRLAL